MNKTTWKKLRTESIVAIFILLLLGFVGYFLFLKSEISNYESAENQHKKLLLNHLLKKSLITSDNIVKKTLATWKLRNPFFYNALCINETPDQLLQLLTHTAEQSDFLIIEAQPFINKKNNSLRKISNRSNFQLKLSGNYADLFHFIDLLNNTAWPFTLVTLKIPSTGEFDLLFSAVIQ